MLPSVFVLPTETRRESFPASDGAKGRKFLRFDASSTGVHLHYAAKFVQKPFCNKIIMHDKALKCGFPPFNL